MEKSPGQALSLAYNIRRRNAAKKSGAEDQTIVDPVAPPISEGGEKTAVISPMSIAKALRAKKMASGGEVQESDDFMDEEEFDELPAEPDESPEMKRKARISRAFAAIRDRK